MKILNVQLIIFFTRIQQKLNHPDWSTGPTSREPRGPASALVTAILHRYWIGDMTLEPVPASITEVLFFLEPILKTMWFALKLKFEFPSSWCKWFFLFLIIVVCVQVQIGRAANWVKLEIQVKMWKSQFLWASTVPQLLEFFQHEKLYTWRKKLLAKNSPGSRHQVSLSTFRFINLLQDKTRFTMIKQTYP